MSQFGKKIRKLRRERELTLSAVAQATGVSTSYISAIERGRRPPFRAQKLVRLAEVLTTDLESLRALAALENTRFELKANPGSFKADVASALARGWDDLDESQLRRLEEVLHVTRKKEE